MEFSRDNLHHAYVIEGTDDAVDIIRAFISKEFEISLEGNPDVVERRFDGMGIDDARWLKEEALFRSLKGGKRFYIIQARSITIPAQNALLKTLEEPTKGTHIFVVMPRIDTLLPTLRSRVEVRISRGGSDTEVETFLRASHATRLSMVSDMLKEESAIDPTSFVRGLEIHAHRLWKENGGDVWEEAVREIMMVERYIYDASASHRFLLEHLALVLPKL